MPVVMESLAERLRAEMRGEVWPGIPLAPYTSFRIGGPAALLAVPADREDLRAGLAFARRLTLPVYVIGGGSNTLVRDGGFAGLAIHMNAFQGLERHADVVGAGAGVRVSRLLAFCCRQGLSGLEMLSGVPGTVGGAVWGNAGAWGGATADALATVEVITADGEERLLLRQDIPYGYRVSGLPAGSVVVEASFALTPGEPAAIRRRISGHLVRRNASQPVEFRSAGSIFKNPHGEYAGRLVEQAGLKGTRIGNAMISAKHGNYIVNLGGARAADVLALVALARDRVHSMMGVVLELEIKVIGDD